MVRRLILLPLTGPMPSISMMQDQYRRQAPHHGKLCAGNLFRLGKKARAVNPHIGGSIDGNCPVGIWRRTVGACHMERDLSKLMAFAPS